MFYLAENLKQYFASHADLFEQIMQLKGEVYRQLEGRCTQRILLGDQPYFLKQHFGVGYREIFKNLSQGKLPIVSAANEYAAIQLLHQIGVPTMQVVGFGKQGYNPATLHSFLLTQSLEDTISLEDLAKSWKTQPPTFAFKRKLIKQVATATAKMHTYGLNHRDLYICHFLLHPKSGELYVIDLHRAQIRKKIQLRWQIKDLAALYFSSKDSGLTYHDYLYFLKQYTNKTLREILIKENSFWRKVKQRGDNLYRAHN